MLTMTTFGMSNSTKKQMKTTKHEELQKALVL